MLWRIGIRLDDEPTAVRRRIEDVVSCFAATVDDGHGGLGVTANRKCGMNTLQSTDCLGLTMRG